jgi:hypothetical protein
MRRVSSVAISAYREVRLSIADPSRAPSIRASRVLWKGVTCAANPFHRNEQLQARSTCPTKASAPPAGAPSSR